MDTKLPAHRIEKLQSDGTLTLENLPFQAGQTVEVIVLPYPVAPGEEKPYPLRGIPVRYDRPTESVAEEDWEALR